MERSLEIHRALRESTERFDTFVLAALLTAAGYMAQSNPFGKIGLNYETLFLASFGAVLLATFFAFRRMEHLISGFRVNHQMLHGQETGDVRLAKAAHLGLAEVIKPAAEKAYRWRNRFIVLALVLYVAAKVWRAYMMGN